MSRARVRRRLAAVLALLLGLGLLGLVLPTSASALPNFPDCNTAPTPEVPGRGVEAFFEQAPATLPPPADPFAPGATTSIHDQYGYAGLRWNTYGLGCGGGVASPEASVGSTVANWVFTIPKATVAATGAMLGAAYQPQFLSVFDPLIGTVVDALRRSIFDQWAGVVLALLGFFIIWRARRSSLSGTAAAVGWAIFVMMLATVLFRWPLAAGQAADVTVTSTMSAVTAALDERDATGRSSTGQEAAANLHDALLYQVWLGGEFGDANSVSARKYGAQLFDAQALTWSQAATLDQDPAAGQQIIDAKEAKFKQVAAQVKAEDPDAYEYLTGRRTDARVGFAALSLLAVACAVPFLLVAALLVIGALVITRFAVMLFPAIATLGLFPAMRSLIIGIGNTVAAAVINALVFGIGTAVMVKAFGVVMSPGNGLPSWLVVTLVLLLTLVMWYALRPFQRLTAMATPGRSLAGAGGALGSVTRGLGRAGGRLLGGATGSLLDGKGRDARDDDSAGDGGGRRAEADGESGADDDGAAGGSDRGAGSDGASAGSAGSGAGGGSGDGRGGTAPRPEGEPGAGATAAGAASGRGAGRSTRGGSGGRSSRRRTAPPAGDDAGTLAAAQQPLASARRAGTRGAEDGGTDPDAGGTALERWVDPADGGHDGHGGHGGHGGAAGAGRGGAAATGTGANGRANGAAGRARSRPAMRRSEGTDLEDVGVHAVRSLGGGSDRGAIDEADGEPYAVYRPDSPGGGGRA